MNSPPALGVLAVLQLQGVDIIIKRRWNHLENDELEETEALY